MTNYKAAQSRELTATAEPDSGRSHGCDRTYRPIRFDRDRISLMKLHPGWRIWFVPNALDGSVTWCAQPEPTIHAYSPEDLSTDIRLVEQDLATLLAQSTDASA